MLRLPVIIVNFKAYEAATGINAVKLANVCEEIASKTKMEIAVAVQAADILRVSSAVKIPVLAQHIDAVSYGKFTGSVLPQAVKEAGAVGTLLNHSEKRIGNLGECIEHAKKAGLFTVVCAENDDKAAEAAHFRPDFIAIEEPSLIAGKISVSEAEPTLITNTIKRVNAVANVPVLCGAGVNNAGDVRKAIELGTRGILISNAVVNSPDPRKVLLELANALH